MTTPSLEIPGAVDMHVHFGPDAVPPEYAPLTHSVTAIEAAREAVDAGFRAIVLKAKSAPSASVAHVVEDVVEGISVIGSVVLDYPAGGLNPAAVEQSMLLGAKVVWLPTTGSAHDCGNYGFPLGCGSLQPGQPLGISVLGDDGKLLPVVYEIFELIEAHDALLATGHVSPEEHYAVAKAFGSSGRVIATHVGDGVQLGVTDCADLAALGVTMEFSALTMVPHWGQEAMPMEKHAAMIRAAGPEHAFLCSDYGWYHELPKPVEGLHTYFGQLWDAGFTEDELRVLACETPARLLGLES